MPAGKVKSALIHIDGASRGNPGPSGIGVVFLDGKSKPINELSVPIGEATNNVAEYLAFLYALSESFQNGYNKVEVKTDSELLARQINGEYKVRDQRIRLFFDLAQHFLKAFCSWSVTHVPREKNKLADKLAVRAAKSIPGSKVR